MTPLPAVEKKTVRTYFVIQALRAIAALLVVTAHARASWDERILLDTHSPRWSNNQSGVDIFFVISGFVMSITLPGIANRPNKSWLFLSRRCIRIIPLYWIFTTLKLIRLKFGPEIAGQTAGPLWHIIASYLFIPSEINGIVAPLLSVGWTLNFEMFFYLLFATALALDLVPLNFLAPALVAVASIGWFHQPDWPAITTLASPLVLEFLFGVLLARWTVRGQLPGKALGALMLVGGFAIILTLPIPPWYLGRMLCWGLPAWAIVTGAVILEADLGKFVPKWLLEAGNASYAIYLIHLFVISPIWFVLLRLGVKGGIGGLVTMIGSSLLVSLVTGIITHRLIELPIVNHFRGNRVLKNP